MEIKKLWPSNWPFFSSFFEKFFVYSNISPPISLKNLQNAAFLTGVWAVKRAENIWGCHLSLEEIICVRDNPFSTFLIDRYRGCFSCSRVKCNLLTFGHRTTWSRTKTARLVTKYPGRWRQTPVDETSVGDKMTTKWWKNGDERLTFDHFSNFQLFFGSCDFRQR